MSIDILEMSGHLALGSRLKRLAERMQADAGRAHAAMGFPMQPSQFSLLSALDRFGPMTVSEAVDRLNASQPGVTRIHNSLKALGLTRLDGVPGDKRSKRISLTPEGQKLVTSMKHNIWPYIDAAAADICAGPDGDVLSLVARMEEALDAQSLEDRVMARRQEMNPGGLTIVPYEDALAADFADITKEWVEDMFTLEPEDLAIIEHPRERILDRGGRILFVATEDLGIIGTCALMRVEGDSFELTKMGVRAAARGRRAGEFLLERTLAEARPMPMAELFLLTNRKCEAAIHLYEKAGFEHDASILERSAGRYGRADVAMSYPAARLKRA